jgi:1-acyl-sn-glycerol-3-phosphate acyltransferase
LRKHFNSVRVLGGAEPEGIEAGPLLVFMNHPSWWDPMIGLFLAEHYFPDRDHFGPIDKKALERYGVLKKMGFFGIETDRPRGAKQFLIQTQFIFERVTSAVWVTPQGEFTDPRQRPVVFKPGIAHVAARSTRGQALPLAVEYPFWEERTPELLVAFGKPLDLDNDATPSQWQTALEVALTTTQDQLAAASEKRDPELFADLLGGNSGVGGIYDRWKTLTHALRGKRFDPDHQSIRSD